MFKEFPLRCCKDHICDCCLNEDEQWDKFWNKQIKETRARSLYEGKVILLGNAEAGK